MKKLLFSRAYAAFILIICLMLPGCSFFGYSRFDDETDTGFPQTSVVTDRESYLEEALKSPKEPKSSETRIIMRLNPQFVLHLDRKHRMLDFEPLNDTAKSLKKTTKKKWKRKPYEKAIRSILEQCVVDGYISDVSNTISIQVIYTPSEAASDTPSIGAVNEIEHNIQSIAEDITRIHGIAADISIVSASSLCGITTRIYTLTPAKPDLQAPRQLFPSHMLICVFYYPE